MRWIGAHAAWQFFDNQWVHPFVFGGVAAHFERRGVRVWEQQVYTGDPPYRGNQIVLVPGSREQPTNTTSVSGVFGGGAKLYVTERAFFRTDARVGVAPKSQSLSFRAGFGIDF
jgi:hypothetical protein